MQVTKQTAAYVHQLAAFTGNVADGRPEQRTTVPAQFQRSLNSVLAKCLARVEVGVGATDLKEGTPLSELEWLPYSKDFKAEEGKRIYAERFTDGELDLTDGEKRFVKWCVSQRDEVPAVSDEVLNEFEELTK